MKAELRILDPRLPGWGFPSYGSPLSAGLDLHACIEAPLALMPQAPAVLISSGIALRLGDPEWCALVLPRSGLGHKGLVLGNAIGLIDADYEGPVLISAWNRNPAGQGAAIAIRPGDRIAQLVVTRIARLQFELVAQFTEAATPPGATRQEGRFGSTGTGAGAVAGAVTGEACPAAAPRPQSETRRANKQRRSGPDDPVDQEAAARDRGGARHRL